MSDQQIDEFDVDDDDATPAVKAQREKIKRLEADLAEANAAKRELAFTKAGIDTSKGAGKLLFDSYQGDLSADAVTAAATEYGLIETAPSTPAETPVPTGPSEAQVRNQLTSDTLPPGSQPQVGAVDAAFAEYDADLKRGAPKADAQAKVYQAIMAAAYADKDPAYIVDEDAWKAAGKAARGDLLPS